jgi:uncharacterized protein (TIGR03437 family)
MTGRPAIAANRDGRLAVFVRGPDNALWSVSQTAPGARAWSAAQSLGGSVISSPAAGIDADGRLDIFAISADTAIWHRFQATSGSPNWSPWASLGGQAKNDPSVGADADGRLEVFIETTDSDMWHSYQQTPGGSWAAGDFVHGLLFSAPAVARNSDGRLLVFAGDEDGKYWWIIQNSAGADSWSSWWCLLGGTVSAPLVIAGRDGTLHLFAVRSDNSVWFASQSQAGSYNWTDWAPLGGQITSSLAAGLNADGRIELFARGADNSLMHASQTSPGGGWSAWSSLGGSLAGPPAVTSNSDGRLEVVVAGTDGHAWDLAQSSPGSFVVSGSGAAPSLISTSSPVVNGASFMPGQGVAPGSFVSIFGSNFASGQTLANFNSLPLASSLAGVTVTFNGVQAPIVGVTANQVNAQVPWSALPTGAPSGQAQVVVSNAAGSSPAAVVPIVSAAPGLFWIFTDSTGVSRPAAYLSADGALPLPSNTTLPGYQSRPAKPNEIVILFATGLGPVMNQPADGAPGLAMPPYSTSLGMPSVLVGGLPASVLFSGLSPQYPGMYQVAAVIPVNAPIGNAVPIQIQMNGITTSAQLEIAISN